MWNVIISNTRVTDSGVKSLAGQAPTIPRIDGTKVTNAGVKWIIDNLPIDSLGVDSSQISEAEAQKYKDPDGEDFVIEFY